MAVTSETDNIGTLPRTVIAQPSSNHDRSGSDDTRLTLTVWP